MGLVGSEATIGVATVEAGAVRRPRRWSGRQRAMRCPGQRRYVVVRAVVGARRLVRQAPAHCRGCRQRREP